MSIRLMEAQMPSVAEQRVEWARSALARAVEQAATVDVNVTQPTPLTIGWTLAEDSLRVLVSLVCQLQPRHVVEFGAGLSTVVLERACARLPGPCRITSIDHDPKFKEVAKLASASAGRSDGVRFCMAPLVARSCFGQYVPLYFFERSGMASRRQADLMLIDGPPAVLGGREGVLYQAMGLARPGTVILLDDADRPEERNALDRWQSNLGDAIEITSLGGLTREIAAIIIRRPVEVRGASVPAIARGERDRSLSNKGLRERVMELQRDVQHCRTVIDEHKALIERQRTNIESLRTALTKARERATEPEQRPMAQSEAAAVRPKC
jgi:predicted O-methyltransferase YrrM